MSNTKGGYYEIEADIEKLIESGNSIYDIFYLKDLQQRKIFLNSDVDQFSVSDVIRHILQINKEDDGIKVEDRLPIRLFITSNGGDVDAGFALIDTIINSVTPVYTINIGYQYSMGFLIGLAGHKRFAMKNSRFLMHDGSNFVYNSTCKAQDQMEFQKKADDRCKEYILSRSTLSEEEYDKKLRLEWYMFADEAKQHGFVDYIIGDDCDISQIL